jgi:hypothetical protein
LHPNNDYVEKLHSELIVAAYNLNEAVQLDATASNILLWKVKLGRVRELTSVLAHVVTPTNKFWDELEKQLVMEPAS